MVATADPRPTTRQAVLALPHEPLARRTARLLQQEGWNVHAIAARDAADLACRMSPAVVVLSAEGDGESGWLTCAKLMATLPKARVILVGETTPINQRFARFVGARALVSPESTPDALVAALR
jgi:DNA-binding NarL/FixJ family response regulator